MSLASLHSNVRTTRVALIAALPGELKPLVRGWPHGARCPLLGSAQKRDGVEEEWIAPARAWLGRGNLFAALEDGGPISLVFSLGWAGALTFQPKPGQAYNVAGVIDVRTGERFHPPTCGGHLGWTSPRVADQPEALSRRHLRSAGRHGSRLHRFARLAAMRRSLQPTRRRPPARLQPLHRPRRRLQGRGGPFGASRAKYWPALLRMGERKRKAAQGIARSLVEFLDYRGHIE